MTMTFIPVQSIRSISQRSLLMYWGRLAARRNFPSLEEFRPERRLHDPQQLVFWNIEDSAQGLIFRALAHGHYLTEAYDRSWAGMTMEEVTPQPMRDLIVQTARACADSGCPFYSIFSTFNAEGYQVDCERLLLPFGRYGRVTQLIGSLQLVSAEGQFTRRSALTDFGIAAQLTLAGFVKVETPEGAMGVSERIELE
jgi:hypothetical protein